MATATRDLDLGTGAYSIASATRIIGRSVGQASPRQIRYWLSEGLTEAVEVEGSSILTFQDLVSLEMISRFRHEGISLQAIRVAETRLRQRHPDLRRPFANLTFYTDGKSLYTIVEGIDDRQLLELFQKVNQYVWKQAVETFATEIQFSSAGTAEVWRPTQWVEINPHIQFGEPVVAGTRVPVRTVLANLEVGSPKDVADWYALSEAQVIGARDYGRVAVS